MPPNTQKSHCRSASLILVLDDIVHFDFQKVFLVHIDQFGYLSLESVESSLMGSTCLFSVYLNLRIGHGPSKTINIRLPFHVAGTSNVVLYNPDSSAFGLSCP